VRSVSVLPAERLQLLEFHLQIHVAFPLATELGKSLITEPQHSVRLGTGGNLHLHPASFKNRYFQFSSKHGVCKGQDFLPPEVGAVALETRVATQAHPLGAGNDDGTPAKQDGGSGI